MHNASDLNRSSAIRAMVGRPLHHLQQAGKKYAGLWREMDLLRSRRAEVGGWPGWCFLPAAAPYEAAATLGWDPPAFGADTLSALFAWRATQGVYRFDQTIFDEVWRTPITGDIPVEVLEGLPEWCCYVGFPQSRRVAGIDVVGLFVQIQYDLGDHERDLHLVQDATCSDGSAYLAPVVLRLGGTVEECFLTSLARMQDSIERDGGPAVGFSTVEEGRAYLERMRRSSRDHSEELAPLVSLALYLASTTRELRSGSLNEPVLPKMQRTRHDGPRIFPPSAPRVWEVGFRIGATLRSGQAAIGQSSVHVSGPEAKTHTSPRPHLRAAHWHSYWVGPLRGERKLILKWLHPILVAAGESEEDSGIVPVVHRVAGPLTGDRL